MAIVFGSNVPDAIDLSNGATSGNDQIYGWAESNAAGNFGPANDHDTLSGEAGDDDLSGGGGNDQLFGGDGLDVIYGGVGNDLLYGGAGADLLEGGLGNDLFVSDNGFGDLMMGGAGADRFETNNATFGNVTFTFAGVGEIFATGDILGYVGSGAGITFSAGVLSGGDAEGDVLVGPLSGLAGSGFRDVISMVGLSFAFGLGGNDRITNVGFVGDAFGGAGDDTLSGFGGADLHGGAGNDDLIGGTDGFGTTAVYAATARGVTVNLNRTVRQATGGEGADLLVDIRHLQGGRGADDFTGNALNNVLRGEEGNDTLNGGAGDDTLSGGRGADVIIGGAGIDTARFTSDVTIDLADATNNRGDAVGDTFSGIERFSIASGDNRFTGDGANNVVATGFGVDRLSGGAGNDSLTASGGNDTLFGGSGNDTLEGGSDIDSLLGGLGDDTYVLDSPGDVIVESGAGRDTVRSTDADVNMAADFAGFSIENFVYSGFAAAAEVTGSGADNAISLFFTFSSTAAQFTGGAGDDTLTGGNAGDLLRGGTGQDMLQGFGARDTLTGGDGEDAFVFGNSFGSASDTGTTPATRDLVTDFAQGEDRIDLRLIDGSFGTTGDQRFEFIGRSAFTANLTDALFRGEVRFVLLDRAGTAQDRTIIQGAHRGDTAADFTIELLGLHSLTAADFFL